MGEFGSFLLLLSSLAAFAGYMGMFIYACHRSTGWGLGMLFFPPVAAVLAAVKDWSYCKRPFLIYGGGTVVQVVLVVVWLATVNPMEMLAAFESGEFARTQAVAMIEQLESKGQLTAEEKEQLRFLKEFVASMEDQTGDELGTIEFSASSQSGLSVDDVRAVQPAPVKPVKKGMNRPRLKKIPLTAAGGHVGKEVRLESSEGKLYSGTLTRARPDRIWVEFYMGAGTVELEFRKHEVRSLKVKM